MTSWLSTEPAKQMGMQMPFHELEPRKTTSPRGGERRVRDYVVVCLCGVSVLSLVLSFVISLVFVISQCLFCH